ncbi:hypothetical protein F2P56_007403 [Juglans regia]|uniref:Uncharacterized protein n=1 Tax=Juglans regia TaxID=51240 RepID=A0A834D617_JUGRE|nr:hypothetical protein F2P56_007403 [Juglans regia]
MIMMGCAIEVVIESKCFILSKFGDDGLRVTKRSWKIEQMVMLGHSSIQWLEKVLEESLSRGKKEVYSATRGGFCSMIAQRCANRRVRYLQILEYNQGGRRNMREVLLEQGKEVTKVGGLSGGGHRNHGQGALRHHAQSYKEALSTSMLKAHMRDGGARVSNRRQGQRRWEGKTNGVLNHFHGRGTGACQETWAIRKRLLEMQG